MPHYVVDPRRPRRLTGGTRALVEALAQDLRKDLLLCDHCVHRIEAHADHVRVHTKGPPGVRPLAAAKVILALPPRLLAKTIAFSPGLPPALVTTLAGIPTWMAGDAKFFALYDTPFWRADGLSGSAFSERGPLSETHDASVPDHSAALFGFLRLDHRERLHMADTLVTACVAQLVRYFGPAAAHSRTTRIMDWSRESFTATSADVPLFDHPDYGLPDSAAALWEGRLRFAGTETASQHGGYLEGALEAAERAVA